MLHKLQLRPDREPLPLFISRKQEKHSRSAELAKNTQKKDQSKTSGSKLELYANAIWAPESRPVLKAVSRVLPTAGILGGGSGEYRVKGKSH